jgi:hypothetical protein
LTKVDSLSIYETGVFKGGAALVYIYRRDMKPKLVTVAFKVTQKDRLTLRKLAKKYTDGNVSKWIKARALTDVTQNKGGI